MTHSTPDSASSPSADLRSGQDSDPEFEAALRALARPPRIDARVGAQIDARVGAQIDARVGAQIDARVADDGSAPAAELAQAALQHALAAAQDDESPRIGTVLEERYRVVSVLGRGGMGVVFGADNLRTGKSVALKWMSATRAEPERHAALLARFDREARVVAKVRHPNVVDVYDVGYWRGKPFLVMEQLTGESLRARIARGPLSWDEAKPLMLGVLRGVAAVHRAGVVHRDLKPDNIFLCRAEGAGAVVPKVLDFGVAAMREPEDASAALTRTGALLGTPAYMALEQLTGEQVDARADVYALGVVLYEMLTQRLPYAARSAADLAVLQATTPPTRPSHYAPSLRGEIEQVVLSALASQAARRCASVEAWAQAIADVAPARGPRRSRRLGLALAGALIAASAGAYLLRAARLGSEPGPAAARPATVMRVSPVRAEGTSTAPTPASEAPAPRDQAADASVRAESRAAQPAQPADLRTKPKRMRPATSATSTTPARRDAPPSTTPLTEIRVDDF